MSGDVYGDAYMRGNAYESQELSRYAWEGQCMFEDASGSLGLYDCVEKCVGMFRCVGMPMTPRDV